MKHSIIIKKRDPQQNDTEHNGTRFCYAECLIYAGVVFAVSQISPLC
jgi:hypothetical protein